eukprot:5902648-Amphidinium_carterae.1
MQPSPLGVASSYQPGRHLDRPGLSAIGGGSGYYGVSGISSAPAEFQTRSLSLDAFRSYQPSSQRIPSWQPYPYGESVPVDIGIENNRVMAVQYHIIRAPAKAFMCKPTSCLQGSYLPDS